MSPEEEKPKATQCPSCQQPAIRSGNEVTCEKCDATFIVTRKQGAKLKQVGAIEDLQQRVESIEARLPGEEPTQPVEPKTPDDEPIEEPILPE